ncbi:MAG: hypothetical protein OEW23_09760 [Candidatus Aminicenantes bacterium]|nr:hypothetical protein [Candidatus Aminicenantes bacterium]
MIIAYVHMFAKIPSLPGSISISVMNETSDLMEKCGDGSSLSEAHR